MKKRISILVCLVGSVIVSQAQYKKVFYKNLEKDFSDFSISVDNAVSTAGETKFKLKITNKSADYIIYKPEESKFVIDGKELKPIEKWLIIGPNETDFRVVNIKGSYINVKNYTFVMDGLYKVPSDTKGLTVPDFKLPVSSNDFKAGSYTCSVGKVYKESDETKVSFDISYNGDKIGFIFPDKASVLMPDGNEYATVKSTSVFKGSSALMLTKGKKDSFSVKWNRMDGGKAMDMQKVPMIIKWKDTFVESEPIKMKVESFNMDIDQALSDAKGK